MKIDFVNINKLTVIFNFYIISNSEYLLLSEDLFSQVVLYFNNVDMIDTSPQDYTLIIIK